MIDKNKVIKGLQCCSFAWNIEEPPDCVNCPYKDEEYGTCQVPNTPLIEEAIELIKALDFNWKWCYQSLKYAVDCALKWKDNIRTPQLLTLEQIKNIALNYYNDNEPNIVWLETLRWCGYCTLDLYHNKIIGWEPGDDTMDELENDEGLENYGKTWFCYTARPPHMKTCPQCGIGNIERKEEKKIVDEELTSDWY